MSPELGILALRLLYWTGGAAPEGPQLLARPDLASLRAEVRPLGIILLALVLASCGGAEATVAPVETAAQRAEAPAVSGTTLTGSSASLADFRGRPLFVVVWSSW